MGAIFHHCHDREAEGHFKATRTIAKVLPLGFYWPTFFKDAHMYVTSCNRFQRICNISRKHEMPLNYVLIYDIFDV